MSTDQLRSLTTTQVHTLTSSQVCALTSTQIQAMTTDQINAFVSPFYTPIVLDLDGNGIDTLSVGDGVKFDVLGTGTAVNTGWVRGSDGLLALDRNGDGVINDGTELFGAGTTLANGQKAKTGYEAMAELDSNKDGALTSDDNAFGDLRVWVDGNADGVSQASELKSLAELNITKLNLNAKQDVSLNNGNIVGLTSTYETADGQSHAAADVWFAGSNVTPGAADLRGSVNGLVQAMSSFSSSDAPATGGTLKLDGGSQNVASSVANLADALKQFDATKLNGAAGLAPAGEDLRLKALHSTGQGFLAAPK
jgi:hypothetical protein